METTIFFIHVFPWVLDWERPCLVQAQKW